MKMEEAPMATAQRDEAMLLLLVQQRWINVEYIERLAQTCRAWRTFITRRRLRRRVVIMHGFPAHLRLKYWLREARVRELIKPTKDEPEVTTPSLFLRLLGLASDEDGVSFEITGVDGEISRDVCRTFPMLPFFEAAEGEGQRQLGNVLKAVSIHAPDIGYCQGMNYVAAALLMHFNTNTSDDDGKCGVMAPQEASFALVVALIRHFDMDEMWRPKMPGLSRSIHIYQQLLRRHFYDLHTHFRNIGMHASLLVTQWFATLFARVLSLDVLVRVWDLVLVDGWKMVFRVALAITAHVRPEIINLDMEATSVFFRKHPRLKLDALSADKLIASAMSYKLTRKMLNQMDDERNLEYLRLRLQKAPVSPEDTMLFPMLEEDGTLKQKESLDFIRSQLHKFDSDTASDMNVLRKKIEAVDRTIAQATSALTQTSYALNEVTFTLAEHTTVRRSLRHEFDTLLAQAIGEASSPRASAISKARARVDSFKLWAIPSAASTIEYMQQSLAGCFERAVRLPGAVISRQDSSSPSSMSLHEGDLDDDDETRRNLANLELLVPHHSSQLNSLFRKVTITEKELRRVQRKYETLQRETQLARVEFEEAQQFKDRLSDQMLQLMLATERQKNTTMQELFAQVDEETKESKESKESKQSLASPSAVAQEHTQ